jgi:heptosyltransferase-1
MQNGFPRILIIRLSAIGDVIRVLPALHTLRDAYPNAQLDWVVERRAADLLEQHPALDRLLVFERPPRVPEAAQDFWRLARQIRDGRYDVVLDFHGCLKSGLLTFASRAPDRYGFARPRARELSPWFTNHKVNLPSNRLSRVEENLLLCEALGPMTRRLNTSLHIPEEIQESVDAYFESTFDAGKRVVAVHAPVDREEKQWPLRYFAELCDLLLADGRFEVLLTYGPGQIATAQQVAAKTRRSPLVAPETPDLKHYAALIQRADLYFGCDTGPMHIACAVGTPIVAVFGGTDPAKHAPWRRPYEVLYRDDDGGATGQPNKSTAAQRLARITPEEAYEACLRITVGQTARLADAPLPDEGLPA